MLGLRIELLGQLRILLDGVSIVDDLSQKSCALLCYLAVEGRELSRAAAATLLWGEFSDAAASASLRQSLAQLRRVLGAHLIVSRHTVALNTALPCSVDARSFEQLAPLDVPGDPLSLRAAINLYRGDFLANLVLRDAPAFDEWALLRRERLRIAALRALDALLHSALAQGDYVAGMEFGQRVLALDPWREEAHRQLMWLHIRTGQRSAALAQYQACRRVLAAELGVTPTAETTALFNRIKDAQAVRPQKLPISATPFVGRAAEKSTLARYLAAPGPSLVTIVGPGGIGKTRLAQQTAAEWSDRFLHGASVVTLASVKSLDMLVSTIVTALGFKSRGSQDAQIQLCEYLADKDMLLVLDNLENLVEAGAPLLSEILAYAPEVKLLVTSRKRLQLEAEQLIELRGLDVPPPAAEDVDVWSAVELFVHSARKLRPDWTLSAADRPAVARICRLVEGMPLGIELSAAWTQVLSCGQIAQEIEQSLEFLSSSLRDVPARHQSVRTVFEHSWRLLSQDERVVMRRLAVFKGGFTREAAAFVAGASLAALRGLVDQSLLRTDIGAGGAARYHLHELVRQFALEHLDAARELAVTQERHLRFFVQLAETAEPHLLDQQQQCWLDQLDDDRTNLDAALAWAFQADRSAEQLELGARLAVALWRFWWLRNDLIEGRRWLDAVALDARTPSAVRSRALHGAGVLAHEQGEYAYARACYEQSLALRRVLCDQRGIAASLNSLGVMAMDEGDYERARMLYEESLAVKRELGDQRGIAYSLSNLGLVASAQGDFCLAHRLYDESLGLCRALGDRPGIAVALGNLGAATVEQGDGALAATCFQEAMQLFQAMGDKDGIAECLEGLASVAYHHGELVRAARLCAAASTLREVIGVPLVPTERARYERVVAAIHSQLGEALFEMAWAAGQALTMEQAVAFAVAEHSTGKA